MTTHLIADIFYFIMKRKMSASGYPLFLLLLICQRLARHFSASGRNPATSFSSSSIRCCAAFRRSWQTFNVGASTVAEEMNLLSIKRLTDPPMIAGRPPNFPGHSFLAQSTTYPKQKVPLSSLGRFPACAARVTRFRARSSALRSSSCSSQTLDAINFAASSSDILSKALYLLPMTRALDDVALAFLFDGGDFMAAFHAMPY